ncbi:beta-(1,2)-glucan production associated transmembrane protein [Azoarcus sp. CIB]|uniref:GH36-type glycosyl hydrolase domain-containing protein n=1 Tax=Aromatoleum sp. (strain CIB) TaxID=198107 RepID=UPI0006A2DD0D|nr:glucoamylase family protein [Azoarcus sp. CIB]AKU12173.1 beta-(1,2)-glucan production associated transmembrane protein [Azoarcus sp. CIB]
MKAGTKLIAYLQQLETQLRAGGWPRTSPDEEPPLRSELFSADQMEQHGKALAAAHRLAPERGPDQLLGRLAANESALVGVCRLLTVAVTENRRITPAGDWLLDNFYLIEEQISTAKRHLPKGYSRELPRLDEGAAGESAGRPRVYDIALEAVAHGDGRVDTESLSRFVAAYQSVTALKLGELWAVPIMLRLALIENLRRVGVRIAAGWAEREQADSWADQMTETAENDPKSLILVIADMARSDPPMVSAFVAELARRLQGRGPALALPLTWIEQRLSESGLTIEQMVQSENQQQAADQVSISNSIGSLRVLGAMDWRDFVESMSVVEQALLQDPANVYARMDFATRDRYRHATEAIARKGRLTEGEVARKAVELARAGAAVDLGGGGVDRAGHVGYYLIDRGLPALEQAAEVRHSSAEALRRKAGRIPLVTYLGAIALITLILTGWLLTQALGAGTSVWALLPIAFVALLAVSQLAVALVNWLATLLVAPHPLPRMDFSDGIPAQSRTLVVVPTMLTSAQNVEDLVEALEVRFLANRDASLHFGLLTDFLDAQQESLPEDGPLMALARTRIEELNEKYGSGEGWIRGDIFFLFHRPRRWNPQERVWMGHERKRGKLADLNALLRGRVRDDAGDHFSLVVGDTAILSGVRYVITLDTDTQLPRDTARQLVAALAHPLNRARYDKDKCRVCEGYAILQPRVSVSLPGTNRSRYARLYGGEPGIDPYTRAVSDVYQDVFGEGSFIGKGIYDVDAFEQALDGCFPENRILSHDLLEGCYARAGLLSDVQVYEDYPARYSADVSRRHRWIRGDWQLAGWLLRRVPGEDRCRRPNPLSMLSQWKLVDNLRRSLVPAALTLLLLCGWTLLAPAWLWTLAVIGVLLIPSVCAAILDLLRKPDEVLLRQHLAAVANSAARRLMQMGFELACLPYEAFFSLDAIVRTAWRMLVGRRRLLEWKPSSEVDRELAERRRSEAAACWRSMWAGPVLAAVTAAWLVVAAPMVLVVAGPILLLWFASPGIAWWISRPLARRTAALTVDQSFFLRALARRTWAFFDTFVGADDHWLPPDNYQEYRVAAIAHRTSPTNIGMALLANLSAYDFGYITAGRFIERTTNTLRTMDALERHRGHFYNWYDTQTLQPLPPLYVSTVDSGNLAGHLLTLRAGLLALADERILAGQLFDGLSDTLRVFAEVADTTDKAAAGPLAEFRSALEAVSASPPDTLAAAHSTLMRLATGASELAAQVVVSLDAGDGSAPERAAKGADAQGWAQALARQCQDALDELGFLAPWLALPAASDGLEAQVAERVPEGVAECVDLSGIPTLRALATAGSSPAQDRMAAIERLALQCGELAQMDYDFLFDKTRHLLTIGYNVQERRLDASYYDLLASEARLCSFVAIAQGQLPQESWFTLGRLLTATGGEPVLLSWSGSMFEYLMPLLVMPNYDNTLLDQTCKAAVARQIEYGAQRGVPWGISESGYNTVDMHLNYQYRAFGVPGLGLKRGLADDLVIAPYASVLALMVAPEEACLNLQRLAAAGFLGKFGFFEAIDYTPARQRRGQSHVVVRSFMAHHQGMSLLALAYLLLDRPMQRRFESDRLFQAIMLLLQERIPKATALFAHTAQLSEVRATSVTAETQIRVFNTPHTPIPEVQLLSNGRYHVMVTNAGGGYSRWKDLAVTRWREDGTCDNRGTFCYVREVTGGAGGEFWSAAYQPTLKRPTTYEAIFSEGRAEFRRRDAVDGGDGDFETYTEIVVSPEDDIELRRIRITNRSGLRREIEVTSYAEVVIAPPAADALHPAFSNLFVQTEILRERCAILCTRRPRSAGEQAPWMLHLMAVHGADVGEASYETDRLRFIGRTRSAVDPLAMSDPGPLSGTDGSVLDPIVAIRHRIALDPEQSVTIDIVSGISDTRDAAVSLIQKYFDRHLADRVFDLTWTHSQVVLRQLNASEADSQLHARLASSVIHANASLRADPAVLIKNRRGQSGLWGYAISGDLPIVLLQIGDSANIDLVRQLVQAHAYWRLKGLAVDLVIWNEEHSGYRQRLQEQIMGLIASGTEASVIDRPGGIFVRPAEQMSGEDRILLQSVARAIITDGRGTLVEQLDRRPLAEPRPPRFVPSRAQRTEGSAVAEPPRRDLILFNGLGGFTPDGREYVMALAPGEVTPAPWVNVLANPHFGTIVSESGAAYTWSENAHEYRVTPWHNDPVSDLGGEALYLRDEESGQFWSPTPLPARADASYVVRHGFGYSVFETRFAGIWSELRVFVALDAAVKFSVLKVRNESGRPRRLSVTGYVEWVLGDLGAKSAMHVSTEIDPRSGALYARNPYSMEFADRVAFFDVDDPTRNLSGDRTEFLGRNGTLRNPAAMSRSRLSGKVGAALDPCGAIQVNFELGDGQERDIVFRLGAGRNVEDAGKLVQRFRGSLAARGALEAVQQHWTHTLGAVQVETPDPSVNVLTNGWLVYQTLACRIWARSGYYQSGGAFGFRDQLQDVMALIHAEPALVRAHLLLCASRQFREGDVQHWWHPPAGRGVRTRCSDDYLWLPLAVCRYVTGTGDVAVLDEAVHFLEGRPVNPEDDSYYDLPGRSVDVDSLYQHCVRAIRHGLRFGERGLPLIGAGDWNDGMNLVGIKGKGESVWLGFFLCEVLRQFVVVARAHGDAPFAEQCVEEGAQLRRNIEQHAWDGQWYRRAWFDDGTPLGSAGNVECRIDSISQSWSVLSGAGDEERSRRAMKAVDEHLVRRDYALVQLLDPPFDKSNLDPGYIRGYVPGVRENGGQYTHGAIWAAMAFAALGDGARAWELLTLINPVNHALSAQGVATYKTEPYVVAADVYALAPHIGRGGWSWYTGSAGWMYRLIVESLLGLRLAGDILHLAPCLPADWHAYKIHYRYRDTVYHIAVAQMRVGDDRESGVTSVTVDGVERPDKAIPLVDDRQEHLVEVRVHAK